jgi:hypothetical protein
VAGFHLTKFFSHTADLYEIVTGLITTDEHNRKEIYNQDLGIPYTPRGGRLTDAALDACRREYAMGKVANERTYMGVDVGRVIHVVIRARNFESLTNPLRFAAEVDTFEDVGRLMKEYKVIRCVVDSAPETRMARKLQADFRRGAVWLAQYTAGTKDKDAVVHDPKNGIVKIDRTRLLDETFTAFMQEESTIPANARDIENYYDQLKAPVRVLEEQGRSGITVARYVETSADHFAHAENYCTAAMRNVGNGLAGIVSTAKARGW